MKVLVFIIIFCLRITCLGQSDVYVSFNDGKLIKFNIETCETTYIGMSGAWFDIALTPSGQLYGTNSLDLYSINSTTGASSFIANIASMGTGYNSLTALNDEYLLGVDVGQNLIKIRTSDGDTMKIGTVSGYPPSGDITFFKGYYYLSIWPSNELLKIQLSEDQNSILSFNVVGTMNTFYNEVFGMLTMGSVECDNDNIKLYAFEGYSVYEVNPLNANCTLVCDSIGETGAWGAASRSETNLHQDETIVEIPNIFTPNNDLINDSFKPIELKGIKKLAISIYNRWGNLVYKCDNSNFSWDGKNLTNKDCSDGTYYYIIKYSDYYCDNDKTTKGFITLFR